MEISLAIGQPLQARHSPLTASGYKPDINSIEWLATKVPHSIVEGYFTTRVEMENASTDAGVVAIKEKSRL